MRHPLRRDSDVVIVGLILERRAGIYRTFPLEGVLTRQEHAILRACWNRRERTEGYLGKDRRRAA